MACWTKYRLPENRAAQYFTRKLNRLETEHDCAVSPCHISSGNNVLSGELWRLGLEAIIEYGGKAGYSFAGALPDFQWYLAERLAALSGASL